MFAYRLGSRLSFLYENYKGKTAERDVILLGLNYGSNEWYPEDQWFIHCWDNHKQACRSFALAKINPRGIILKP